MVLCSSEVKVFRFGDNIWRKMASFTPFNLVDTLGYSVANQQGVHLSGTVNWISIYPKDVTVEKFVIISLDLATETYRKLPPPPGAVSLSPPYTVPHIAVLMDRLCFSHHLKETHFVIWQMMEFGVEQSWTQFLKISFQNLRIDHGISDSLAYGSQLFLLPLCVSESTNTLIMASNQEGYIDYWGHSQHAILYNWRENKVEQIATNNRIMWFDTKDYVESLVSTS